MPTTAKTPKPTMRVRLVCEGPQTGGGVNGYQIYIFDNSLSIER